MQPIKNPVARVFLHIGMWLVVVYSTLPFAWTLLNSFKTIKDATARPPKIIFEPTLESYQKILIESVPENAALIVYVLLAIIVVLVLAGGYCQAFPRSQLGRRGDHSDRLVDYSQFCGYRRNL